MEPVLWLRLGGLGGAGDARGLRLRTGGSRRGAFPNPGGPVGARAEPGWTDIRLLSLQQEHRKLVFNMPMANSLFSFLRLTQGHRGVLQALIKPAGRADAPLGSRELRGLLCLQQTSPVPAGPRSPLSSQRWSTLAGGPKRVLMEGTILGRGKRNTEETTFRGCC